MAKTQKEIMNALLGALEKGEGDLSDLEALMDRVKKDIAEAKAEEKARKEKEEAALKVRGDKIADMATRVLNDKATEADVALVMESYMHNLGIKDAKVSAKDIQDAKAAADKATGTLDIILDALNDLFTLDEKPKPKAEKATKNADDVLNEFLKTLR
jgi:hypothetical protein